jgi:Holliday junction resolvasome RuvABC ATP-dependent DNA helicase subunit
VAARGGIPVMDYPPFIVFVDEAHLLPGGVQEGLLTLLEMDDRTMMVGGKDDRMIIRAYQSGFILATTKPSLMDKPLRSRCSDVPLARYSADEVAQMLGGRFPHLPEQTRKEIAVCARVVPRRAFEIAREVDEEREYQGAAVLERGHVLSVLRGRGVVAANGITLEDVNYLKLLNKANRPLGERMAVSAMGFADADRLVEDIEPFLIYELGYVRKVPAGREITERGRAFLNKWREEEEKRNENTTH